MLYALKLGQRDCLVVEDTVHVSDEFVDTEVDNGEIVKEPHFTHHCLLKLQQPRVHFFCPLYLLEPLQLFRRLLLTINSNHVSHVLNSPNIHLYHSLVAQSSS